MQIPFTRKKFTRRVGYFIGFAICAALLISGLLLQYVGGQNPSPLCILQRIAYTVLMFIFLIAGLHHPREIGTAVYTFFINIVAIIGAAFAFRQVWLQQIPRDKIPRCNLDPDFMFGTYAFGKTMRWILRGAGECADQASKILGLTVASWSLLFFIALGVGTLILALYKNPRRSRKPVPRLS